MYTRFDEVSPGEIEITHPYWRARLRMNQTDAIFYQHEQLERTGTIDNFRIAAGEKEGERRGFFYSDSDAHKWADAAARILGDAAMPDDAREALQQLLGGFIETLARAQRDDGYLFTYNQLHFPRVRWKNLQIEHELYTLGHLIEAGVSLVAATGDESLLTIARRFADLAVDRFAHASPRETPGHPEIELALVKLYRLTDHTPYLELARRFVEQRGRMSLFGPRLVSQFVSQVRRARAIARRRTDEGGHALGFDFTENLTGKEPRSLGVRTNLAFLNGTELQQHAPIRALRAPVGHAVRWGYLATAATLLVQHDGDESLLAPMQAAWDAMVMRRMYVTGGVGSVPMMEAFGRDYELDNDLAYCETCAALASVFWSWELLRATGRACYADLIEWQLYNAAAVGIALDGHSYLYRNPLRTEGELRRRPWFHTACCPSNVSRTWASLGGYVFGRELDALWIHQYIGAVIEDDRWRVEVASGLPWDGEATITVTAPRPTVATLQLRIPSWTHNPTLAIDGEPVVLREPPHTPATASGYSPYRSFYVPIRRAWEGETSLTLTLPMPITAHVARPEVPQNRGHVALSRGPIVYCLEGCDNPSVPDAVLEADPEPERSDNLGGVTTLRAGELTFIPYYTWANREPSSMQVWVRDGRAG